MTAGRVYTINQQHWNTPEIYCEAVENFFGVIYCDPCSNEQSKIKALIKYNKKMDGLKLPWNFPTVYVNPPYGRSKDKTSIKNWIEKSYCAYLSGSEVIMLIPVATNTSHWKEFVFNKAVAICFIAEPRIKFENLSNNKGAPMACAFVYYGNRIDDFKVVFSQFGNILYGMTL